MRGTRHGALGLYALQVALVTAAYYLAGRIGLELAYLDGAVAAVWPPAGLGLAVLFLYGVRLWPGIVIGDLLLGDFSTPLGTVLGADRRQHAGGRASPPCCCAGSRTAAAGLERVVDVLALVACALVAALVSAAFGPTSLRLGDVISTDELARVFRTWTLSDASGVLVVAPVLLDVGRRAASPASGAASAFEGAVVLALLVVLAELPPQRDVPYIVFPVLLWAALRFGPRGAATAILVVCSITVWNTAHEDGPFVRESITDSLLSTQLFIATSALTSLLLAAVTAERARTARALAAAEAAQRALADEQAALRRVATLVAERRRAEPRVRAGDRGGRAAARRSRSRAWCSTTAPHTATVVGAWSADGPPHFPVGTTLDLDGDTRRGDVVRSGAPSALDRYDDTARHAGGVDARLRLPRRRRGARDGRRQAVGRAGRSDEASEAPLPDGVEQRLCDFADSSPRRSPTPTRTRSSRRRAPGSSRSATRSAGGWSATSTTARSSASSRCR